MCKLNVTSRLVRAPAMSTEKTELERRSTYVLRYALFISYFCDITVTVVCVRKRTDALAGSCAEKLERMAGSSGTHPVVPGAILSEPLQSHAIQALRWWLLCRALSSWRKAQLIDRFVGQVSS